MRERKKGNLALLLSCLVLGLCLLPFVSPSDAAALAADVPPCETYDQLRERLEDDSSEPIYLTGDIIWEDVETDLWQSCNGGQAEQCSCVLEAWPCDENCATCEGTCECAENRECLCNNEQETACMCEHENSPCTEECRCVIDWENVRYNTIYVSVPKTVEMGEYQIIVSDAIVDIEGEVLFRGSGAARPLFWFAGERIDCWSAASTRIQAIDTGAVAVFCENDASFANLQIETFGAQATALRCEGSLLLYRAEIEALGDESVGIEVKGEANFLDTAVTATSQSVVFQGVTTADMCYFSPAVPGLDMPRYKTMEWSAGVFGTHENVISYNILLNGIPLLQSDSPEQAILPNEAYLRCSVMDETDQTLLHDRFVDAELTITPLPGFDLQTPGTYQATSTLHLPTYASDIEYTKESTLELHVVGPNQPFIMTVETSGSFVYLPFFHDITEAEDIRLFWQTEQGEWMPLLVELERDGYLLIAEHSLEDNVLYAFKAEIVGGSHAGTTNTVYYYANTYYDDGGDRDGGDREGGGPSPTDSTSAPGASGTGGANGISGGSGTSGSGDDSQENSSLLRKSGDGISSVQNRGSATTGNSSSKQNPASLFGINLDNTMISNEPSLDGTAILTVVLCLGLCASVVAAVHLVRGRRLERA